MIINCKDMKPDTGSLFYCASIVSVFTKNTEETFKKSHSQHLVTSLEFESHSCNTQVQSSLLLVMSSSLLLIQSGD
jgi:hypothetical protein